MKFINKSKSFLAGCTLALLISQTANGQRPEQRRFERMEGYLSTPQRLDFNESLLKQLQLPRGFQINVFAKGLGNPRNLVVAPNGIIYVTRREEADVIALRDTNRDGRADSMNIVAKGLKYVNGITINKNRLYIVTDTSLYDADLQADGSLGKLQTLISNLPDAGQHPNRTMAFGPDGMLYISVGSTCNACDDGHEYWVDQKAGYSAQEQTDLIQFLLSIDDNPVVLPETSLQKVASF